MNISTLFPSKVYFLSILCWRIDSSTADDHPQVGVWFPSNSLAFSKNLCRDTNTPSLEVIILYTCIPCHERMLLLLLTCDQQGTRHSCRENFSVTPQIRLANGFLAEDGTVTRTGEVRGVLQIEPGTVGTESSAMDCQMA